jgi:hypothetical protein
MEVPYLAIVAVAVVAVGAMVLLVHLLRTRCPGCRKPTLELDLRDDPGGSVPGVPTAKMFRCLTCAAEFRRDDGGPLIPKIAWDAGARDELPRAKVHR